MDQPLPLLLPPVIAHRGDRAFAPENTLSSFRQAATKGASWVEFDATLCRDTASPPVIFHDDRVGRTTNLPDAPLTEIGFDALRTADAGSWFSPQFKGEQVPTLAEAVELCQSLGLGMNIEVKVSENGQTDTPEPYDEALAVLTAKRVLEACDYKADGKLLFSSFSTPALIYIKSKLPEIPRGYLLHKLWPSEGEFRGRLRVIEPSTLNLNQALLTSVASVAYFRKIMQEELGRELPILVYTVNDYARANELINWGVSALFSDDPAGVTRALKNTGAKRV